MFRIDPPRKNPDRTSCDRDKDVIYIICTQGSQAHPIGATVVRSDDRQGSVANGITIICLTGKANRGGNGAKPLLCPVDIGACGDGKTVVSGVGKAAVCLMKHADEMGKTVFIFLEDFGGLVYRAVVDAKNFKFTARLLYKGIQTAGKIFFHVVNGNYDANLRVRHFSHLAINSSYSLIKISEYVSTLRILSFSFLQFAFNVL
jgi:hypothetical protein